jgi:thiopeptide-type bacteriocin biosynthesis protein
VPAHPDSSFTRPDFFVFRTALLPFDVFLQWSEGLEAPGAVDDPVRLEEALLSDRRRLRERLNAIVLRPEIREALFLASPDLDSALERWLENPEGKKGKRLERTLVRYFSRMCGRSTPFGLFAGHSIGHSGETTRLEVDRQDRYRRHTRLDMDYLCSLIEALARDPLVQTELLYRPNSSLYRTAGRLRYFESRLKEKTRSYHLVAVEETDYLLETLQRAGQGAIVADLAQPLVGDEVTLEDATGYVRELVESQLLVPDLAPKATGPEPIHDLISQLRTHPHAQSVADRMDEIRRSLEAMDGKPLGIEIDQYKTIAARLESLPAKVELSRLVQVDMVKPADNATLGGDVLDEIARAVGMLRGLRPEPPEDEFSKFREKFRARYEDREMPLFEVLDEENGIGFGASQTLYGEAQPLLAGLAFPQGKGDGRAPWGAFDTFLLNKLDEIARAGSAVLNLEPKDLERFTSRNITKMADSFVVTAKLAARSQEALDAGDFKILFTGAAGPSGANLLGRFCHGDAALFDHVRRYLETEESLQPESVFAEIVHLPEGRVGNVILRPSLRTHEIPFLGRSAVAEEHQIPVSDLTVSIQGQTVVLQSRRLGKRIIPRLTSAHNFRRGLGIYRFLCSLQYQSGRGLAWNWGSLEGAHYLPRVVVGRVVLFQARWRVERKEIQEAIDARDAPRYALAQQWRRERRIPRFVLLIEGDNTLPFDLDNALSVDTFVELVKKRGDFRLQEMYPGRDELCAAGAEGRFVHELVVPLTVKREIAPSPSPRADLRTKTQLPRTFPPGSEWLFAKLYTGSASADQLLQEVVSPLVEQVVRDGSADGWFFMRFGDPDWHLRVRFHGDPGYLSSEVLPRLHALCAPLLESGLLWKIELGTYEREIERYGSGDAMLLAERLFQIDSEAVLNALASISDDSAADIRWRFALRGVDQLLDDLGFDLKTKLDVLSASRRSFLAEFDAPAGFEHQFGDRFRRERKALEELLNRANDASSPIASALSALHTRSQMLRPLVASLRQMSEAGQLSMPLQSLAGSYAHMHTNRILRSAGRAQELVIYDFLVRLYESQKARSAKETEPGRGVGDKVATDH